jgi:hypothetical protein
MVRPGSRVTTNSMPLSAIEKNLPPVLLWHRQTRST